MTTQRNSILESLQSIAPKFPLQDVDIPDISTANGLNMPPISSVLDSGFPGNLYSHQVSSLSSSRSHPDFPGLTFSSSKMLAQQFSTARMSPSSSVLSMSQPLESSEDSDDNVPLAQLVQRQADDLPQVKTSPKIAAAKKPRMPKKKKKKDPNEPQKPVSAYALFLRDTQAAVKSQNPIATFREVSKIMASMWEGLDPEHKTIYEKKTDIAKKEYLKQLAAYQASLVSQQTPMEDSPSTTGTSPPQPLSSYMNHLSPQHMGSPLHVSSPLHAQSLPHALSPLHAHSSLHISNPHCDTSPPHLSAQYMISPLHVLSPVHLDSQQHENSNEQSPPQYSSEQSPPQYNNNRWAVPPFSMGGRGYDQHMDALDNSGLHMDSPTLPPTAVNAGNINQAGKCIRCGCHNHAIDNIGWDNEYCSNECVVSHCRDVFAAWVANRQVPVDAYAVK